MNSAYVPWNVCTIVVSKTHHHANFAGLFGITVFKVNRDKQMPVTLTLAMVMNKNNSLPQVWVGDSCSPQKSVEFTVVGSPHT